MNIQRHIHSASVRIDIMTPESCLIDMRLQANLNGMPFSLKRIVHMDAMESAYDIIFDQMKEELRRGLIDGK